LRQQGCAAGVQENHQDDFLTKQVE
jgi:hypothetical protein